MSPEHLKQLRIYNEKINSAIFKGLQILSFECLPEFHQEVREWFERNGYKVAFVDNIITGDKPKSLIKLEMEPKMAQFQLLELRMIWASDQEPITLRQDFRINAGYLPRNREGQVWCPKYDY